MKFRKKPVVIEAMQVTETTWRDVYEWMVDAGVDVEPVTGLGISPPPLTIHTLEGEMTASDLDWVICGVRGEFYPCKPDIFEATYEPLDREET